MQVGEFLPRARESVEELGAGFRVVVGLGVALHGLDGGEREETGASLAGGGTDKWDAREVAFQILGVAGAVGGMMQQRINVMENVFPRDTIVVVENLEQRQRLGRDVVAALLAVFGVAEQREALR